MIVVVEVVMEVVSMVVAGIAEVLLGTMTMPLSLLW